MDDPTSNNRYQSKYKQKQEFDESVHMYRGPNIAIIRNNDITFYQWFITIIVSVSWLMSYLLLHRDRYKRYGSLANLRIIVFIVADIAAIIL